LTSRGPEMAAPDGEYGPVAHAVRRLGGRVTVAEVVAETGLAVDDVEAELGELLRDARGLFEVGGGSDSGGEGGEGAELVAQVVSDRGGGGGSVRYVFPPGDGLFAALDAASATRRAAAFRSRALRSGFRVLRGFFGVFLVISIGLVAVVAVIVWSRAQGGGEGRGGGGLLPSYIGRGGGMGGAAPTNDVWCLYWWYYNNPFFVDQGEWERNRAQQPEAEQREQLRRDGRAGTERGRARRVLVGGRLLTAEEAELAEEEATAVADSQVAAARDAGYGHFGTEAAGGNGQQQQPARVLDSVFSFLFGDGEPGPGERARAAAAARFVRQRGGVVLAEELTPLLVRVPPASAAAIVAGRPAPEGDVVQLMAALLARFGGHPVAFPSGGVAPMTGCAFHFALLSDDGGAAPRNAGQPWLEERPWMFSAAPLHHLQLAAALGVANFLGVRWLLTQATLLRSAPSAAGGLGLGDAVLSAVFCAVGVLRAYAALFLVVPVLRWLALHFLNDARTTRNRARMELAVALDRARMGDDSWLSRRVSAAREAVAGLGV